MDAPNALTRSPDTIEGEFVVILPKPPIDWSFWRDDLPVIAEIVAGFGTAALILWAFHR